MKLCTGDKLESNPVDFITAVIRQNYSLCQLLINAAAGLYVMHHWSPFVSSYL